MYIDYGAHVLTNRKNRNKQVEQNSIIISNERELKLAYDFWNVRRSDLFLVNLLRFEMFNSGKLETCSVFGGTYSAIQEWFLTKEYPFGSHISKGFPSPMRCISTSRQSMASIN
jgi:hypothetical protein